MPRLGDLQKGLSKNKYNWYRWAACESCGKERWVMLIRGELRYRLCVHCPDRSKQAEAMRMTNLGATRSLVTREKISNTRKQMDWEYSKVAAQNPMVGDKTVINGNYSVFATCSICEKARWVRAGPRGEAKHSICIVCVNRTLEKREITLRQWAIGERDSTVKRLMKAQNIRPNKPEQKLSILLDELYPAQWHYTGDGKLVIGGKNPDFWNGNHKLVEMWGDYWHKGENPQKRIDHFKEYGYKCLIIWEKELKDKILLIPKIRGFVEV